MPEPEKTMLEELAELRAQVAALSQVLLPDVVPAWGIRTCQVCGEKAEVIDIDPESRVKVRNGEGYCTKHGREAGVFDGAHITKPGPKA
jgi:hypothetical protein